MAVLFFFYLLSENFPKKHTVTIILLLFAILIPSFFTIVSVDSRGMVVLLAVQFLVAYFIFKKNISNKINKKIKYTSLIFLSLFAIYSISVTKSRFGESSSGGLSNEAQDSLIFYLGHSMLTFAYGITDTIKEFFWGDYILGNEEILKIGIDNMLGTHFDTNFFKISSFPKI
jgi:cation transport ATPase